MLKLTLLAATASIFVAGCGTTQPSGTWATIKSVPHAGPFVKDRSATYAENLHKTLQAARVEHKVVTFKFRYHSRLLLTREGEETAVVFRNSATPSLPWWLMSERLWSPVWLPTQPVESQVAFYVRRPATVVKVEDFTSEATKPASASASSGKKKAGRKHGGKGGKSVVKPSTHSVKSKAKKSTGSSHKAKASRRPKK